MASVPFRARSEWNSVLGPSETVGELSDEFGAVDQHWRIFRNLRDVASARIAGDCCRLRRCATNRRQAWSCRFRPCPAGTAGPAKGVPPRRGLAKAYDAILDRFAARPACSSRGDGTILHVFGDANKYLDFKGGRFSRSLPMPQPRSCATRDQHRAGAVAGATGACFVRRCQLPAERRGREDVQGDGGAARYVRLAGRRIRLMVTFAELARPKEGASKTKARMIRMTEIELYHERIRDLENGAARDRGKPAVDHRGDGDDQRGTAKDQQKS